MGVLSLVFEIRKSNIEIRSKLEIQNPKLGALRCLSFEFRYSNLFRISDFALPLSRGFHGCQNAFGCKGRFGHTDADGIENRVADGGGGRDGRRLADANDAALRHVHHVHHDLRHILNAAELVELHVRVDLPAGLAVEDALLEEGIVDAHDDAARDLRLAAQLVDDHAAVLYGDDLGAANDAGLGVDLDFGDLNAADAVVGPAGRPVAGGGSGLHAELGTG